MSEDGLAVHPYCFPIHLHASANRSSNAAVFGNCRAVLVRKGTATMYMQYGCGLSAPIGWRNFDASPTLRLQRIPLVGWLIARGNIAFPSNVEYGDVTKGLPLPNGICQGVYCSHVLEHLALNGFRKALLETFRVLRVGGVFRLVIPDLEYLAKQYMTDDSPNAAIEFMKSTLLGKEERDRSISSFLRDWLGNSHHLWMWDYKALEIELRQAGFREIRKAHFGDSADPKFREVEEKERWARCVGVECRRL